MKTELATIVIALAGANAFTTQKTNKVSTKLNGKIDSQWAYDPYGSNEQAVGKTPNPSVREEDSWMYQPWSGIGQTDFYPLGAPVAAETPEPAAEPMPEPTVAVPEQSMAQA